MDVFRKKSEQFIQNCTDKKELEVHYKNFPEGIQSCVLVVDKQGRIENWNSVSCKLTKCAQEELHGKYFYQAMPDLDIDWIKEALSEVIHTGMFFRKEDVIYQKDGKAIFIDLKIHPLYDKEMQITKATIIIDDVTERKTAEQRLMESEKLVSMGRLTADIAHELNSPLDGALRYTEFLLEDLCFGDPRRNYAQRVQDVLLRMARIVKGLLHFSRQRVSIFHPVDIHQSLKQTLALFDHQIAKQNIQVKTKFDVNIPTVLYADIEQVFLNLIKNAIEAMPGGGALQISTSLTSDGAIEFKVGDTGHGIPEEIQDRVFDPFFTTKEIGESTGLGLAISKEIVERYNGTIDLKSAVGEGTVVTVKVPCKK